MRLTNEAFQRGSNDNISCIVVAFKFDHPGAGTLDPSAGDAAFSNAPPTSAPSASGLSPAAGIDPAVGDASNPHL